MTVVDSVALGGPSNTPANNGPGFYALSAAGTANLTLFLNNVTANNVSAGVAAKAIVRITKSTFTRNEFGVNDFSIVSPGAVYTFGDNNITGNQFDINGALTPVSPQ
jgi:hypothetical protein